MPPVRRHRIFSFKTSENTAINSILESLSIVPKNGHHPQRHQILVPRAGDIPHGNAFLQEFQPSIIGLSEATRQRILKLVEEELTANNGKFKEELIDEERTMQIRGNNGQVRKVRAVDVLNDLSEILDNTTLTGRVSTEDGIIETAMQLASMVLTDGEPVTVDAEMEDTPATFNANQN